MSDVSIESDANNPTLMKLLTRLLVTFPSFFQMCRARICVLFIIAAAFFITALASASDCAHRCHGKTTGCMSQCGEWERCFGCIDAKDACLSRCTNNKLSAHPRAFGNMNLEENPRRPRKRKLRRNLKKLLKGLKRL